jgi:carboxyl-terminal processing protease
VIGETTYGTGTVLSEFVLKDGSSILLGVAEWLTPDGDFIRETGIAPDIKVPLEDGAEQITPDSARDLSKGQILGRDAQLRAAYKNLQSQ